MRVVAAGFRCRDTNILNARTILSREHPFSRIIFRKNYATTRDVLRQGTFARLVWYILCFTNRTK